MKHYNKENFDYPTVILPRKELRIDQFRRFELLIAEAQLKTFPYNPQEMGLNSTTFVARFKDAIRGFCRYKYPSKVVLRDFDWSLIKVDELTNGLVIIKNIRFDLEQSIKGPSDEQVREMLKGATFEEVKPTEPTHGDALERSEKILDKMFGPKQV
jgi:hypothetical protein